MSTFADLQSRLTESKTRPILLDGAVGTELERRGLPLPPPLWSAGALRSHPDMVREIHREYVETGAEIIVANTFRVTHRVLAASGLGMDGTYLAARAVDLARSVIADSAAAPAATRWVAASVGPVADCYRPQDTPPDEVLRADYRRTLSWINLAKPDLIWLETMNSVREAKIAAELAARTTLPFVVSFMLQEDGRLLGGDALADAVDAVTPLKPLAIGLNCMPPGGITKSLPMLARLTALPLAVYAHLGTMSPLPGWSFAEDLDPAGYVEQAYRWRDAGGQIIGGCCGSRPAHIRALAEAFALPSPGL